MDANKWLKENWKTVVIVLLIVVMVLLIFVTLFSWYRMSPIRIKKNCAEQTQYENGNPNLYRYNNCLIKNGLSDSIIRSK